MGTNGKARSKTTKILTEGTVKITIDAIESHMGHMGIVKIAIIDDDAAAQPLLWTLLGHQMLKVVEQKQQLLPPQQKSKAKITPRRLSIAAISSWN